MSHPAPHIHLSTQPHTHTIILLHGTSQTGPSFASPFLTSLFPHHNSTTKTTLPHLLPTTKFIFPTGLPRHVTVLSHTLKNAWFDIHSFSDRTLGEVDQLPGLKESVNYLTDLVKREVEILGGEGEKVIVGGFSQGAAMSAFLLLSGRLEEVGVGVVGGWVVLSGWLPFRRQIWDVVSREELGKERVRGEVGAFVRGLIGLEGGSGQEGAVGGRGVVGEKVWIANGKRDGKVLLEWGEDVRDVLRGVRSEVSMEVYDVGHWWCEEMMKGMVSWIVELWGETILAGEGRVS